MNKDLLKRIKDEFINNDKKISCELLREIINIKGVKVSNVQMCKYDGLESIENFIKNLELIYGEIDLKSITIKNGDAKFTFDTYSEFDKDDKEIIKTISDVKVKIDGEELLLDKNTRVIKSNSYVIVETPIYYPQLLKILESGWLTLTSCETDTNLRPCGKHEEEFYFCGFDYIESTNTEMNKNKYYYCFSNSSYTIKQKDILAIVNEVKKLENDSVSTVSYGHELNQLSKDIQALTQTIVALSGANVKE